MKFKLEIELGNEAMQNRYQVAAALRKAAFSMDAHVQPTGRRQRVDTGRQR
jgi:hypothetical protein